MALPRPSLLLILDIDERIDSKDLRLEIDRCYSYISQPIVRTHTAPEDSEPENTMRIMAQLGTRRYLFSADEDADTLWNEVVERFFNNTFYKLDNHMQIFNRRQREEGNDEVNFTWLSVELEGGDVIVDIRLDSVCGIEADRSELLTQLRNALNNGSIGEGVVRVTMPSAASYEEQKIVGLEEKAKRDAQRAAEKAAEEEALRKAEEEAEAKAEEMFLESPELTEDEDEFDFEAMRAEIEAKYELPEADFAIDYTIWTVEYENGDKRTFDSASGELTD